jgi:hypothetical protein
MLRLLNDPRASATVHAQTLSIDNMRPAAQWHYSGFITE